MLNLRGFVNEVTNDAWMANFALVDQVIFSGSLNADGTDPGKRPGYLAMSARVRAAADYLTKLTGETWTPAEVQERLYCRGLKHFTSYKRGRARRVTLWKFSKPEN